MNLVNNLKEKIFIYKEYIFNYNFFNLIIYDIII